MNITATPVSQACVDADDLPLAVRSLAQQLPADAACTLVFCAHGADRETLAAALDQHFNHPVVGCTTAGEVAPNGYTANTLSAISFGSGHFQALPLFVEDVNDLERDLPRIVQEAEAFAQGAERDEKILGILLVDGLGMREERVALELYTQALPFALVGGSAGDDLQFEATHVLFGGKFHPGSAVLLLVRTRVPFLPFKIQHHQTGSQSMVVTRVDPDQRRILQLNGRPAAAEYARLTGTTVERLDPVHFSTHPVAVRRGGQDFLRSIRVANEDGSLDLYCEIEHGAVLRLAHAEAPLKKLQQGLGDLKVQLGDEIATLCFDCVLRRLEFEREGTTDELSRALQVVNPTGFNTYGEQYNAMHVNQTLVGVAFRNTAE